MASEPGLLSFLEAANENEAESLTAYSDFIGFIDDIDALFRRFIQVEIKGDPIAGTLFLNAHASLLAACRLAVSGQSPPTFMALRGALESALYGLIAAQSEKNRNIWINRATDLDASRRLYTARKAFKLLKDDPGLQAAAEEAYELSIDFGAHPNPRSILEHIEFQDNSGMSLTYLQGVPSLPTVRAIVACIETGTVISFLFPHVFPNHENALQLHGAATEIRQRLNGYLIDKGYMRQSDGNSS